MIYSFNGYQLNPVERILVRGEQSVTITPKARDLLMIFLQNPGVPLNRRDLMMKLWPDVVVGDEALTVQVSDLRKALAEGGDLIKTIPREGYMWTGEAAVRTEDAKSPQAAVSERTPRRAWQRFLSHRAVIGSTIGVVVLLSMAAWQLLGVRDDSTEWALEFSDDFERQDPGPNFLPISGTWNINFGGLRGSGSGFVSIDLVREFPEDVRIDFDASIAPFSGKKEIALFLRNGHDAQPSGYCLSIGADQEVAEIDRNNLEIKLDRCPSLQGDRSYHASVVRSGSELQVALDRRVQIRCLDPIPLSARDCSVVRIGTYDGLIRIDNLRIYRKRLAEAVEPTTVGDQLFIRGDVAAAQDLYERVVRDQEGKPVAGEALFKLGMCLLERKQYADAFSAFQSVGASPASDYFKSVAVINAGRTLALQGDLESAFSHFINLEATTTDPDQRYQIASDLLLLADRFYYTGRLDRAVDTHKFIVEHFEDVPLLTERAALHIGLIHPTYPGRRDGLLDFLKTQKRIGKPRHAALEYLGTVYVMAGDYDSALAIYDQMEREFQQVNVRLSLRGLYGQAMVLCMAGRAAGAEQVARKMEARLANDPYPGALFAEYSSFAKWSSGDIRAAAALVKSALVSGSSLTDMGEYGRLDLGLLYLENGQGAHAEESLVTLLSSPDPDLPKIASLFLDRLSLEAFDADLMIEAERRCLFAFEYLHLGGRDEEALKAYPGCLAWTEVISPIVCRARIHAQRLGFTTPR
ncbi:MAG: tetratricopeptide repeat protein [Acidobacteriota bacterium]